MAVIGYGTKNIGTLRLWQAEALTDFDFAKFNDQHYLDAVRERNEAEDISKVLYPNDNGYEGKVLRLKQQYFFCSASLQGYYQALQEGQRRRPERLCDARRHSAQRYAPGHLHPRADPSAGAGGHEL